MAPHIFYLGTRWRFVVVSLPSRFTPKERASCTYWIGGWVWRAPEPVWTQWWSEKYPSPTGTRKPQ